MRTSAPQLLKIVSVSAMALMVTFSGIQNGISGEKKENTVIRFNGNDIELGEQRMYPGNYISKFREQKRMFYFVALPDEITVRDLRTGDMVTKPVPIDMVPVAINGEPILGNERKYNIFNDWEQYNPPVYKGKDKHVAAYLFNHLRKEFNKLEDGMYMLGVNNMVVDNSGELAYYLHSGIEAPYSYLQEPPVIDHAISIDIDAQLTELLQHNIKFAPATNQSGDAINARISLDQYRVVVKDHQALLMDMGADGGC